MEIRVSPASRFIQPAFILSPFQQIFVKSPSELLFLKVIHILGRVVWLVMMVKETFIYNPERVLLWG